jgi:AraC family transcriptional regulator, ethanolamine operon transcriptional activator
LKGPKEPLGGEFQHGWCDPTCRGAYVFISHKNKNWHENKNWELDDTLSIGDVRRFETYPHLVSTQSIRDVSDYSRSLPGWRLEVVQFSSGAFNGETTHFHLDNIEVIRETSDQALMKRGTSWPGAMVFSLPIRAEGDGWLGGRALQHKFSLLTDGHNLPEIITPRVLELVVVAFKREWFALRAQEAGYGQLVDHAFRDTTLALLPSQLPRLQRMFTTLFQELAARPLLLQKQASRIEMESLIIDNLLVALASAKERKPRHETPSKKIADRARTLVLERSSEPPGIGELALALGVSRRHLQNCFQEAYGVNAVRILRIIRLNRVRTDFQRAISLNKKISIGDVAAEWGFWHWSRFSASYREMFGELPSETMRQFSARDL